MAKKSAALSGSTNKNSAQPQQVAKCNCQDPYKCDCGNRPPRPSKGHKWYPETQEWGGKGHKQRGASGQTADVAKQAIITAVGKTQVSQWQRLPTALLDEACQKQGRALPNYEKLVDSSKQFRYRVFVRHSIKPQQASSDRDLVILPASPVENEEQAKQEAALLALLQLTPNLPHERKLPEPYKTTWLHAIANTKKAAKTKEQQQSTKSSSASKIPQSLTSSSLNASQATIPAAKAAPPPAAAKASTNLTMAHAHISVADQKRKELEKRQLKNETIHRQEAIRLANRDHPVFLSPKLRRELECMLRDDADMARQLILQSGDDDDDGNENDLLNESENESLDLQYYVRERLIQQGFTKAQARAAYLAVVSQPSDNAAFSVDFCESAFDECLQWLCIHLEEDQLPERFDPRGRTLDVVVPTKPTSATLAISSPSLASGQHNNKLGSTAEGLFPPMEVHSLASRYGLDPLDARLLLEKTRAHQRFEEALWDALCLAALRLKGCGEDGMHDSIDGSIDDDARQQILDDELEAITAMFPDENECRIDNQGHDLTIVQFRFRGQDEGQSSEYFEVELVISKSPKHGKTLPYPWVPPDCVLISRQNNALDNTSSLSLWCQQGVSVHVRLIQHMQSLPRGEPMLFAIYNVIQQLLEDATNGGLDPLSLRPFLEGKWPCTAGDLERTSPSEKIGSPLSTTSVINKLALTAAQTKTSGAAQNRRRPRDRSFFWSTPPHKTPPAIAFPSIGSEMRTARSSLPAAKARSDFLEMMKTADQGGRVVLVTGDTGCGKTTQIPAFLLEELPVDAKIVVAQPRRLAATGVATRVAYERGENRAGIGSVGYVVRGDTAICKSTRLLFCTTGILLRQLQCDNALACVTHVVVDEVHERHLDTDVLLGILKGCLEATPNLRIVLMSATLDADRFAAYWGKSTPRLHIPGRTFPVSDYTLEDILNLTGYIPPKKGKKAQNIRNLNFRKTSSWADSEKSDNEENTGDATDSGLNLPCAKRPPSHEFSIEDLLKRIDETRIDYDLLGQLVRVLLQRNETGEIGSILVFLPGAPEINLAIDVIRRITKSLPVQLLPLHGGLLSEEQNLVFKPAKTGFTKVILSTNVAETSITIPDCTIVIDSCREKQSSCDPVNRMPLLLERFASKASLKQRRGRAGRVKEGRAYKLISKLTLEKLPEHSEPEIRRCALDQTLLSLLFLGIENGTGNFLQTLLDPPTVESISAAILSLEKLGAVGQPDENTAWRSLTPLGMHLAAIPAPPTVGKILVMGCILGCRSAALAMAASMSVGRSPFLRIEPTYRKASGASEASIEEMKQNRIIEERSSLFKTVGNSDHAMIAAAYLQWDAPGLSSGDRKRFCDVMGLSVNGMREMKQLVQQFSESLNTVGFVESAEADSNIKSWRLIRTTAVAALAPSQIVRVQRPGAKYAETAEGAMEIDGVAKELKFFIRTKADGDETDVIPDKVAGYHGVQEERVYLHPASANFSIGSFSCPWLVYHELVRTSKAFVRDSTECSTYALLLFGGKLKVQAEKSLIVIDDWVHLSAVGRIGALIGGLRQKVDDLLLQKIENPSFDIAQTTEMKLIVKLLIKDGLH